MRIFSEDFLPHSNENCDRGPSNAVELVQPELIPNSSNSTNDSVKKFFLKSVNSTLNFGWPS